MHLRFALAHALRAGDPYLGAIVPALRGLGHQVAVTTLGPAHPDDATRAAVTMLEGMSADERMIVDSLCLPAFARLGDALAGRGAVAFIREPGPRDAMLGLLPRLRRVIVTAEDTRQRLAEFGVAAERIRVIEPGVADLARSDGPARISTCVIFAIDTLWPRSDHAALLRALARLPDSDWTLAIAGKTRDPSLMGLVGEAGIGERTHFADAGDARALEQLWHDAGLFALATVDGGDRLTIAEALRRGVPIAAAAGAAVAGSVPPHAAVIAAPGDHVALSNGMRRLIFDHDLRRDMAEAAWARGRALPSWGAQALRFANALGE